MKEVKERGSGTVKRVGAWTHSSEESGPAREDITADGIVCGRLGRRLPEAERWDLRPTGMPSRRSMLRLSQAQPRQSEEKGGRDPGNEQSHSDRETKRTEEEGVQEERAAAVQASASDAAETEPSAKRTRGRDTRVRDFFVFRKDVNRFGPRPRCPGCADVSKTNSVKHAHNDECRNRISFLARDLRQS